MHLTLWIAVWLMTCVPLAGPLVAQSLPQSVLILDQYAGSLPWVGARNSAFRTLVNAGRTVPISIYEEYLDSNRFAAPNYKESLKLHFGEKYRDKPVGLIVAFGPWLLTTRLICVPSCGQRQLWYLARSPKLPFLGPISPLP